MILIRDTEATEKNPFDLTKRIALIRAQFPDESKVVIVPVDDPGAHMSVYIGRDVGYNLIQLDETTEKISATDLRKKMYEEAGKTFNPDTPANVR